MNNAPAASLALSLRSLEPGDHVVLLYSSTRERRAAVAPFIAAGLARGERCLWIEPPGTRARARRWLEAEGVDPRAAEQSGQLVFQSEARACLDHGRFNPARAKASLLKAVRAGAQDGYPALRVAVTTKWTASHPDAELLESYEESLSRMLLQRHDRVIGLCQYDRRSAPAGFLTDIVLSHPLVISGGRLYRNRFPVPARALKGSLRSERELEFLLHSLQEEDAAQARLRFLSDLVERSSQPIVVADRNRRILLWNPAFLQLTGYDDAQLARISNHLNLTPPDWQAVEREALERLIETGQPQRYEKEYFRADGTRVPVEILRHVSRDASGQSEYYFSFVTDITARKQAESQLKLAFDGLKESEERYRVITENMSEAVWVIDLNFRIIFATPSVSRLSGYTAEELMHLSPEQVMLPGSLAVVMQAAAETLTPGHLEDPSYRMARTLELELRRKNGEVYVMESTFTLLRDGTGRPTGILCVGRDTTTRRAAEEKLLATTAALKESEERFRAVAETATDAIVSFDENGRVAFWNRSAEKMFGFSAEEALGRDERAIFALPVEALGHARSQMKDLKNGNISPDLGRLMEGNGIRKNGVIFPVEFSLAIWKAGDRVNTTAIIRDVTRRRKREQLLRDSEERYRSLIDMAPDAIFSVDRDYHLTQWNKAAEKLFGYTAAEIIGRPATLLLPEKFHESALASYRKAFQEGVLPFGGTIAAVGMRKDGSTVPLEARMGWHKTADETLITQMSRDVSERLKAEQDLRRAQAQAIQADKLAAIGRLAFSVAHEVNNPLTVMLMSVSFLLEDTPENDSRRPDIQNIHHEIMRIRTLVKGLLDFSRPSEGRIAEVDLKDTLQTTLALVAKSMEVKGIECRLSLPPPALSVQADRSQLTQVFHNLLVNSMEAMPKGGLITISLEIAGGRLALRFTDTGSGIAPDIQKSIFEPFFTTKRETGGTGLGLSISRNIIERFGGTMAFTSTPGEGTTFIVTLPAGKHPSTPSA